MINKMDSDQEFEKINKDYFKKVKNYQESFKTKSIEELKKDKLNLKPNFLDYLCFFFSKSDDRIIKLGVLEKVLKEKLDKIEKQVSLVQKHFPVILEQRHKRLLEKLQELKSEIDQNRLAQEMVYWAQKMDISEELDRLTAHISEVRNLLEKEGESGRRLNFLMQELNREANTLSSKSNHEITSHAGVNLKVYIEEMREQIQNIE